MSGDAVKDYDVTLKIDKGVLRYFVVGERSFQASIKLWQRIYQDCENHKIFTVHATIILSGSLSKMEIPLIIKKLIALNSSRPITCAWVDHNYTSYLDNMMGERIPRPEAMNIRIFNNDQEAEAWLESQQEKTA